MPAPFSENHHNDLQIKNIAEEIKSAILAKAEGQEGLIKVDLAYSINGHGLRPWGDYGKGDYRDFTISVGGKKWEGLTKQDLVSIKRALKVEGFETKMDDLCTEMYEWSPTIEVPRSFIKFGEPCDEFKELAELVKEKYGISLGVKDLYLTKMSYNKDNEYGDRFYLAYAQYRCKDMAKVIKSFDSDTTCEIVTIDTPSSFGQFKAFDRAVTLKFSGNNISATPFV